MLHYTDIDILLEWLFYLALFYYKVSYFYVVDNSLSHKVMSIIL